MDISAENKELILARLKLAQALLEDSDRLSSVFSDETLDPSKPWLHPRHEREAVVVYLLLTCFDILGQKAERLDFKKWIKNEKTKITKSEILSHQENFSSIGLLDLLSSLYDEYNENYGAGKCFRRGIESLPDKGKLLASITVSKRGVRGEYGDNTSIPPDLLQNKTKEQILKLKLNYIYNRRNNFTHNLEQFHSGSSIFPMLGGIYKAPDLVNRASWGVDINDDHSLSYCCFHEGDFEDNYYEVTDWPFLLFEVIYGAIGVNFKRTSINLMFNVRVKASGAQKINVPHAELEDIPAFLATCELRA